MPPILPIPTTRISDSLTRSRLLSQLQSDQRELFRVQSQISTGRRISAPSEDAPAAQRAISLQRLLERKDQVQTNLGTNLSFLTATDSSLGGVSGLLSEIQGSALSVSDVTSSDAQRSAVAIEVDNAIQQLIDVGNQRFRGRFLFAGSQTTQQPFQAVGNVVQYQGNEEHLLSYSDIDVLFQTNLHGQEVFGGLSTGVQGTVDLNPILTADTRLTDLRAGSGISPGSIAIADGVTLTPQVIDISTATTLGDVADLIEANPPPGRTLTVNISATGLELQLDTAGGGNLTVREVGSGTTAAELGILEETGVGTGLLTGKDLDPKLRETTPLANILGVRAGTVIHPTGSNNDLVIEAAQRGPAQNGVTVTFVDGGPGTAGSEAAAYDSVAKTLIVTIEDGVSTANQINTAINNQGTFTAKLDTKLESSNDGTGTIQATTNDPLATGITAGGSGIEFDQSAGLVIENDGQTFTISLASAVTVEDLLNILNGSPAGVLAEINDSNNGIDLRSRLSGTDFSVGENGGATATQLGVRSFTRDTRLDELNHGVGVPSAAGQDFIIRRKDGQQLAIDVSGAATIGDVIDLINNHPDNQVPISAVTAQLASVGNGIELITSDTATTAQFAVLRDPASFAANALGLVPEGQDQSGPPTVGGGTETITGRDVNPQEVAGVFTALIRLRDALRGNNSQDIERSISLLDDSALQLNFSRAELGARQQGLEVLDQRLTDEKISLKQALSNEIDTDLAAAISNFTARQAAFQASLQTSSRILQTSLLDFL